MSSHVGGMATSGKSTDNIDGVYARLDGGLNSPGYFTNINQQALINVITLYNIADAIREAINTTSLYKPSEMPEAIRSITANIETEILGGKW